MFKRSRRMLATVGMVVATSLTLSACGGTDNSTDDGGGSGGETESSFNLDDVSEDADAAGLVPEEIKSKGTLKVGSDTTYPPNEFIDDDGKTIVGMDIDLIKAIGKKLGLEMEPETAAFETIIPSIGPKFDIAISSFTINEERKQVVDFVSYYEAGTMWAVKEGDTVDPDDACGIKVSVQTGTVQEEDITAKSEECTAAGKEAIDVQKFDSQGDATTAVVTGKTDAMLADLPVTLDAIAKSDGALVEGGEMYDSAPYGIALPKGSTEFADAVLAALNSLMEDGTYDDILEKWGAEAGAIDTPEINPAG